MLRNARGTRFLSQNTVHRSGYDPGNGLDMLTIACRAVNGKTHEIGIKNKDQKAILSTIYQLRNRSGRDKSTLNYWGRPQTHHPSIQGRWSPVANDASAQQQQQQQISE